MKKGVIVLLGVVVALLAATVVVLLVWRDEIGGNKAQANAAAVCDTAIVATYNKASNYEYRGTAEDGPSKDSETLQTLQRDIRDKAGYESDPTCQVIIFWAAIDAGDEQVASEALTALKTLHEDREFPDNNLRTSTPLFEYDAALEYISGNEES